MHAAVDTLIQEADFSPRVAFALVKAMGSVVEQSQLVTVPVLDSRVAKLTVEMDTRFAELRAEMLEQARAHEFERAAVLRDRIHALERWLLTL